MKNLSQKMEKLIHRINDEEVGIKLLELIESILNNPKLDLSEIVYDASKNINDFQKLVILKHYCYEIAASTEIDYGLDNTFEASLFVVPILFNKPKNQKVKNIDKNNFHFGELVKTFRKTGLFPEESNVFIHHYLYHPNELMDASYNDINKILKSMTLFIAKEGKDINDLKNLNPIKCQPFNHKEELFSIRYILGIKVSRINEDINTAKLESFTTEFSNILNKLLNIQTITLPIDDFYSGLEIGTEAYTAMGRRINIQQCLKFNKIQGNGIKGILEFDFADTQNSKIKLLSKLNKEIVTTFNLNPLYSQTPEELIELVSEELTDSEIKIEDIFVQLGNKLIPISIVMDDNYMPLTSNILH